MAKLMEIIDKKQDLKNGTVSLKFLDTTFTQLTRKIGTAAEIDYKNLRTGDMFSKETIQSLNREQLSFAPRLRRWQEELNKYLEVLRKKGIDNLKDFEYTFTSLVDYSSKYIPDKTLADYYLLQEMVNAEKEIYEFGHYWGRSNIMQNAQVLQEWSKKRNYGSTVGMVRTNYELRRSTDVLSIEGNIYGIAIKIEHYGRGDFIYLEVSDLKKIPTGENCTIKLNLRVDSPQHHTHDGYRDWAWARAYLKITRNRLGNKIGGDDGYYTFSAWGEGEYFSYGPHDNPSWFYAWDKVREYPSIKIYTGKPSTHFQEKLENLSLPWLKDRVIR